MGDNRSFTKIQEHAKGSGKLSLAELKNALSYFLLWTGASMAIFIFGGTYFTLSLFLWAGVSIGCVFMISSSLFSGYLHKRKISKHMSLATLSKLNPLDVEEYVAKTFQRAGYEAKTTNHYNDGGIDVIVQNKEKKLAIQVKRYRIDSYVEANVITALGRSMKKMGFKEGMVVTTAKFSPEAIREGKKLGIHLINGESFTKWSRGLRAQRERQKSMLPI